MGRMYACAGANVRVLKNINSEFGWDTHTIRSAAFAFASVALLALVLVAATLTGYHDVLEQQTKSSGSHQKGKEDLSMFRDSSVSFYDPGDTAADSDILPREVLEDDGSREDREDANKPRLAPNYGSAHWFKTGQGTDVHGDLQEENRARRAKEQRVMDRQDSRDQERERAAEHTERMRLRERRAAVVQELREQQMQKDLAQEDAVRQAQILKHSGLDGSHAQGALGKTLLPSSALDEKGDASSAKFASSSALHRDASSTVNEHPRAYEHPFAADKLGMQNLVMAEFSQDENRIKATTQAIFGKSKDESKWSHGGLLLSDVNQAPPRTLHAAMEQRRARLREEARLKRRALAKQQELSAEAQMRRHEAQHAHMNARQQRLQRQQQQEGRQQRELSRKPHLRCTIEMLEHGECSSKPHVGTHGDLPLHPHPHAPASAIKAVDADESLRVARAPQESSFSSSSSHKTAKAGKAGGVAARAAGARLLRHQHPAAVVTVPTAGTVISGWASDVGSLF